MHYHAQAVTLFTLDNHLMTARVPSKSPATNPLTKIALTKIQRAFQQQNDVLSAEQMLQRIVIRFGGLTIPLFGLNTPNTWMRPSIDWRMYA